jgi:hypothetical protein
MFGGGYLAAVYVIHRTESILFKAGGQLTCVPGRAEIISFVPFFSRTRWRARTRREVELDTRASARLSTFPARIASHLISSIFGGKAHVELEAGVRRTLVVLKCPAIVS